MNRLISTFFFIGFLRPAPGTWGSLAAIPFAYGLHLLGGPAAVVGATAVLFLAAFPAIRGHTSELDDPDLSEIVIDEVVGQWIALLPVSFGAMFAGVGFWSLWPGVVAAFVLFRLFDILKPGPIGMADKRKDATGVMLDDVIAGVFAAISVTVLATIAHLVLL